MKYKRIFTGLLIGLLYTQIVNAQFPQDLTYQSIQPPNLTLPDYLDTITDASVPDSISIQRITQYDSTWNWYPVHDYAKIQPWNADVSIYKFSAVAIYDANTHQMIRELPGGDIWPCYWSNTNPDLMYSFRESGYIRTYSVSADTVTDMNTDIQGYDIVKLGPGEGNIDNNDKYVALIGKRGSDMDVIVFDLQLNQIVHTEIFAGAWGNGTDAPEYIDWVSVSQSGNYVGIMWNHNTTSQSNPFNNHYGVEIYNTTDMQYLRRIANYGNHGDFGYAQDGNEVFVQFWGQTGTLNMYYLNGNGRVVLSTNSDFDSEGHVSCRNINRPGYAYVSQDYQDHSGQIIAFKLDSSGLVEHFGHHFSTSSSYLKSPMPVPTPNGDKIMFKSDFGDLTADVIYVFESSLLAPDLAITDVSYSDTNPYLADLVTVTVVVKNEGNAKIDSTQSFSVDYFNDSASAPAIGDVGDTYREIYREIAPDDTIHVILNISNDVAESWNSYLIVDTDELITELDETNNIVGPYALTWQTLPTVSNINITLNGSDAEITWDYPISADSYKIYKTTDPYDYSAATSFTSAIKRYTDTIASGDIKYFYVVTAVRNYPPAAKVTLDMQE